MKRRTLDLVFSVGGVALALLLAVLGFVLQSQANFAKDYVADQLEDQRITFTPEQGLDDTEKQADCLVENAGKPLSDGKQAECYANEYIAYHLTEINGGKTYSETSTASRAAAEEAKAAKESGAGDADEKQAVADELNGKVQSLFRGETLRGLLLTTYGFSIFGERAAQAALVCFGVALILILASLAGFVHARSSAGDDVVS